MSTQVWEETYWEGNKALMGFREEREGWREGKRRHREGGLGRGELRGF